MSKTYEVKLGIEQAEQSTHRKLRCPPIVPDMGRLLGEALGAAGWDVARDAATKTVPTESGPVTARVDLLDPSLEITSKASGQVVGRAYDAADNDKRGRAAARKDGEAKRGTVRGKLTEKTTRAVMEAEPVITAEVQSAVQSAVRTAVLRKAASMGTIESVLDGEDARGRQTTTIVIEV